MMATATERRDFLEEIATLHTLAEEAGIAHQLLEAIDELNNQVANTARANWQDKEWRALKREALVRLSLDVLRAFRTSFNLGSTTTLQA
jgi:hypothetical protein